MKMLVVLALAAVAYAEPEADAQVITTAGVVPSVYSAAPVAAAPALSYSAGVPVVSSYHAPAVTTTYTAAVPAVSTAYTAAGVVPSVYHQAAVVPAVHHAATVTNYNNPSQYTAVEHTPFGNKYVAKNGPVVHVAKREADAQVVTAYNAALPYVYSHPTVYNTAAVAGVYAAPVVAGVHPSNFGVCTNNMGVRVPC